MAQFSYNCPKCGTQLSLRKRVTLTKRRCSQCGTPITPAEIDRQQKVAGGFVLLCLFLLMAIFCSPWLVKTVFPNTEGNNGTVAKAVSSSRDANNGTVKPTTVANVEDSDPPKKTIPPKALENEKSKKSPPQETPVLPDAKELTNKKIFIELCEIPRKAEQMTIAKIGKKPTADDPVQLKLQFNRQIEIFTDDLKIQIAKTWNVPKTSLKELEETGNRLGWPRQAD